MVSRKSPVQSAAARASLMGGKQLQSRKMIGMKDFGVAPESLMLQPFLWADPFGLFLSFFLFFLLVRMQAHTPHFDSSFPAAELKKITCH